ncbi:MAG: gamma-glutamyl-gamma-aminobutyrate hydrolase family protein [Deltaproteobacteria bacterium]|nr:gamma-glutamyl-gamma-aminobutyrate hydrolase family protein [Deltaproteobacteria bacterium]
MGSASATSPLIGISHNFLHADPTRALFKGMTLQFIEQRMAQSVWRAGGIPMGLPDVGHDAGAEAVMERMDGLLLAGGADLNPVSYGETPLQPQWNGDRIRDEYEIRLIAQARRRGIPIFGVCRGIQLINVALGGALFQDITTQQPGSLVHRDWEPYDANGHAIRLESGSWISRVYGDATTLEVNSIHHQGISTLAPPLRATAWAPDGVIEAVEMTDDSEWIMGVQWHPEWLEATGPDPLTAAGGRASGDVLFDSFLAQCRAAAQRV